MDKRYNPTEVEEKWVEIWSNEVVSDIPKTPGDLFGTIYAFECNRN